MKLTKLQRHTAYILMLAETKFRNKYYDESEEREFHSTHAGFCFMYYLMTGEDDLFRCFNDTLPELKSKQPTDDRFWFPPGQWNERKEILEQCIKETA